MEELPLELPNLLQSGRFIINVRSDVGNATKRAHVGTSNRIASDHVGIELSMRQQLASCVPWIDGKGWGLLT